MGNHRGRLYIGGVEVDGVTRWTWGEEGDDPDPWGLGDTTGLPEITVSGTFEGVRDALVLCTWCKGPVLIGATRSATHYYKDAEGQMQMAEHHLCPSCVEGVEAYMAGEAKKHEAN